MGPGLDAHAGVGRGQQPRVRASTRAASPGPLPRPRASRSRAADTPATPVNWWRAVRGPPRRSPPVRRWRPGTRGPGDGPAGRPPRRSGAGPRPTTARARGPPERAGVVVASRIVGVDGVELHGGGPGGGHRLRLAWTGLRMGGSIVTVHAQCGDRSAGTRGGRCTGRTWARGFDAGGGGVEGGVLDVVAHGPHVVGAHRLHVHEGAAVVEPEPAVVVVGDGEPEVHELGRGADVDLEALEDGLHGVALEARGSAACAGSRRDWRPSTPRWRCRACRRGRRPR